MGFHCCFASFIGFYMVLSGFLGGFLRFYNGFTVVSSGFLQGFPCDLAPYRGHLSASEPSGSSPPAGAGAHEARPQHHPQRAATLRRCFARHGSVFWGPRKAKNEVKIHKQMFKNPKKP